MLSNRSVPRVTVIPELAYLDVNEAVDWLCAAFGFTVRLRIGTHRVQMNVGDGALVVRDWREADRQPTAVGHSIMIRVENADEHCARAMQHGALVTQPPTSYPYGERQYNVVDFAGYRWTFTQSEADVDPREWGGTPEQL